MSALLSPTLGLQAMLAILLVYLAYRFAVLRYLLIVALAIGLGLQLQQDPGYVLLAFGVYTIEMPAWFAILCCLILFTLGYAVIRALGWLGHSTARLTHWRALRRIARAERLTTHGNLALTEGRWRQAERLLTKAAAAGHHAGFNYLAAAKAAQQQQASERRDRYLREAQLLLPAASISVGLQQAELQIDAGQLEQALASLEHLHEQAPSHPFVLRLLSDLYVKVADWPALLRLLPALRKHQVFSSETLERLTKQAYSGKLQTMANDASSTAITELWQSFPGKMRHDVDLIITFVKILLARQEAFPAEAVLRSSLQRHWDERLAYYYGLSSAKNPKTQLAKAEHWLRHHPTSAALLLSLGRLCVRNQLWGKAKEYLQQSLQLEASAEAYMVLAQLAERLGNTAQATEYYRAGLSLAIDHA